MGNANFQEAKVPSMDKIEPYNIYVGNELAAQDREMLQINGITHILVAARGLGQAFPNDFQYLCFDLVDKKEENIEQYFLKAYQFIEKAGAEGSILVHCEKGKSRSTAIVIGYLMMKNKHIRLRDAYDLVRQYRNIAQPNVGFMLELENLERIITERPDINFDDLTEEEYQEILISSRAITFHQKPPNFFNSRRDQNG